MHVTEIRVEQIIFHYKIFNSGVQFSHYNMPAFTRKPVSAYAKARLCEAYTKGEDFVEIARILSQSGHRIYDYFTFKQGVEV